MKHNQKHNQKGFTLIELIVVVAIMGVIGAILIPQFSTMNLRARLSTDVSSIKTVQNQVEIYYNDKGIWPGAGVDGTETPTSATVINDLATNGYLDARYLNEDQNAITLQTKDGTATVEYDADNHRLYLQLANDSEAARVYNNMDDITAGWVRGAVAGNQD